MEFVLNRGESLLTPKGIKTIEERNDPTGIMNAKYVGDLCIKDSYGNWENNQRAIFYQHDVSKVVTQKGGKPSNYFSIFKFGEDVYIGNGISAVETPIEAIMYPDGEIIFSRFRHDYRHGMRDGNFTAIDGGRDYFRIVGNGPYTPVHLYIKKGKWFVNTLPTKMCKPRLKEITKFIP